MFNSSCNYFKDANNENLHLEFIPNGFDINSDEQALVLASICYHIKTGYWKASVEALRRIIPNAVLDSSSDDTIKKYFSGEQYLIEKDKIDHFQKQRNPFILEVMANCMLYCVEMTPGLQLSLAAMNKIHLSSKIQGLDAAAIATTNNSDDYYIIIGEAKNRDTPSEGASEAFEAFEAFNKHDRGESWADIRQLMGVIADAARLETSNGSDLSDTIVSSSIWKEKYIYRLSIEHRVKKPQGGSQFKDFASYTPNIIGAERRQCEAFATTRLTPFYDKVSQLIVQHITNKGGQASA